MKTVAQTDCPSVVFRVLIVEDELDVLNDLNHILTNTFPRVQITVAENVRAARELIDRMDAEHIDFDLAILDFKLPADEGMNVVIDDSLCKRLRPSGVPIVHITAWVDDAIIQHLKDDTAYHTLHEGPVVAIQKTITPEWIKELVEKVKPYFEEIVSEQVVTQLHKLFGDPSDRRGRYLRDTSQMQSATYALSDLQRAIRDLWTFLTPEVKDEIRSVFQVVELDGPKKRLSLFAPQVETDAKTE